MTKKPDPDDSRLFRDSIGEVKPVRNDRVAPARRHVSTRPKFRDLDEAAVLRDLLSDMFEPVDAETGDELLFVRPGIQQRTFRKLRRGHYVLGAELDLHGMSAAQAREAVADFLYECTRRRVQCARIVHGKGLGSRHRAPVLKNKIGPWLQQRDEVLAYASARNFDGGTGALYVLLRRK